VSVHTIYRFSDHITDRSANSSHISQNTNMDKSHLQTELHNQFHVDFPE